MVARKRPEGSRPSIIPSLPSVLAHLRPGLFNLFLQSKLLSAIGRNSLFLLQKGQLFHPESERSAGDVRSLRRTREHRSRTRARSRLWGGSRKDRRLGRLGAAVGDRGEDGLLRIVLTQPDQIRKDQRLE